MKKVLLSLLCLTLILCFVTGCQNNNAQETENTKDGYQYKIVGETIEIISYDKKESKSIVVPGTIVERPVKTLGKDAFYQCKNAETILLPQTLTTFEGSPFYRCYSLKQIFIPRSVENIDANPFFRCRALEKIVVDEKNDTFEDVDGVLFDEGKTVLIAYPEGNKREEYIIPSTVKKINIDSFGYRTNLKKLTIGSNVVEFPEENMFIFPDDIVLCVEQGSAAEAYAKKHNLKYNTNTRGLTQGTQGDGYCDGVWNTGDGSLC